MNYFTCSYVAIYTRMVELQHADDLYRILTACLHVYAKKGSYYGAGLFLGKCQVN